ncbi:hypothetical protein PR202_ga13510 [Eleusine coracana subsp. coracana]|uniref:Topoisomerase 6 subunit A/Spo11 TOPRIM domain-containing protein n=1 Tax=Eleusine coracana subsp. coracana TaxID=191504 RepID=A0AAV5CEX2_ELECO|nr:hypothetical protein PR202_ga13510 [Eleusine coracana subsp. coracana]
MTNSVKKTAALLLQEEATQIFQQEGMLFILEVSLVCYCNVDSDPYGFDIMATYKFGSLKLAYDAKFLRVPNIRWLGVFTSDLKEYCLPDCCRLQLSPEDRRKAEGILTRCYMSREAPEWR